MTNLTTAEVLERAISAGPLAHVREEIETEVAAEQAEAAKQLKKEQRQAATALKAATGEFTTLDDQRWQLFLRIAELTTEWEQARDRLRAAQRAARRSGVTVEPVMDKLTYALTKGEAQDRKQLHKIRVAVAVGV